MRFWLTLLLFANLSSPAAVLEYSGRVLVGDRPFTGTGSFAFALVTETGEPLWSSGSVPVAGEKKPVEDALALSISNGVYTVRLGDSRAGLPPLDEVKVLMSPGAQLRVWFNDGTNGWHRAGVDIPLDAVLRESRTKFITSDRTEEILRGLRALRTRLEEEDAKIRAEAEAKQSKPEGKNP